MQELRRALVILGLCLWGTSLRASSEVKGTMCGQFFPDAVGCAAASEASGEQESDEPQAVPIEASRFDAEVLSLTADEEAAQTKLLVYFHGHGGSPSGAQEFLKLAVSLGYDVISLDYDYGRDYDAKLPAKQRYVPENAHCAHPNSKGECDMGLDPVCGCYTECYGERWRLLWEGGKADGLPTVSADWSIATRLKKVIVWLRDHAHARYARYLDDSQWAGVNWRGKLVDGKREGGVLTAGHSLGSSLALFIAKSQRVERVIMLSGPGDKLAPDSNGKKWEDAYGCRAKETSGVDALGRRYTFPKAECQQTAFEFGEARQLGNCQMSLAPVEWLADNAFSSSGKELLHTVWKTDNARFYGFEDSNDTVCNWTAASGAIISTHLNWATLLLMQQHALGYRDGWKETPGTGSGAQFLAPGDYRGVVVINGQAPSQICANGDTSGHNAVISDHACDPNNDAQKKKAAEDAAKRSAIWRYLLTN